MGKKLLIVESPAKAKTIEKYLGGEFEVVSSYGHIRDLDKEGMGIDIEDGFTPKYIISEDKKKVVSDLKAKAKKSEEVWLATDEDREGEAISWHLCEVLNLDPTKTKRIVFHEITKKAIQQAVQSPRTVDMDLVNAQQARRVMDRLVGFEISPVLWRKLSGTKSLSAGRVQSVAVKLIVEREQEINKFTAERTFKTEAYFKTNGHHGREVVFKAEGEKYPNDTEARAFLEQCIGARYQVSDIHVRPGKRSPSPPFTTSTLQQEASRKLGFSVARTMRVAQSLYENGFITYMRTDSVNLSDTALEDLKNTITRLHGEKYYQLRKFKNKNESAQEAHEAIRPTDMSAQEIADSPDGQKLYNLIWKRTMASQMADAVLEKTTATIDVVKNNQPLKQKFYANGEVIKFDGFLKVYFEGKDDEDEDNNPDLLPPLEIGQWLTLDKIQSLERFSKPNPRYSEASLVKKLEELGIGRPSTYAPTISTIQQRGYVEKKDKEGTPRYYQVLTLTNDEIKVEKALEHYGAEKAKLFPTDLGIVVTEFLNQHFANIMDYGFTASIEDEFDQIAAGKKEWNKVIANFYHPFHENVEDTMEHADRAKGDRELGIDPESGKPVIARLGRFGPMVQIGTAEDQEQPRFASLRPGQSITTITLEEALDLFKLPFDLQEYKGHMLTVGVGRFGPYVKWNDTFVSIPKGEDPLNITYERAVELLEQKLQADAPVATYQGKPVTKGRGRFGPFIKWGDLYVNVPARYNFDQLSEQEIFDLIQAKVEKEANRYIHNWEDEKISVQNGRWGPFIKFGKNNIKLVDHQGKKIDAEAAAKLTLDDVKKIILAQMPDAFEAKTKTKKTSTKKAATKKSSKK